MLSKLIKGGLVFSLLLSLGVFASAQQTTTQTETTTTPQTKVEKRAGKRARQGQMSRMGRRGKFHRGMMRSLNLTDAQKEQIRALHNKFGEQFAPQRQEIRTLSQKKRQGSLTAEEQARFDALKQQMKTQGEQMRQQVDAILTPEQLKQRDQIKQEMKRHREEMRRLRQDRKQKPVQGDGTVKK